MSDLKKEDLNKEKQKDEKEKLEDNDEKSLKNEVNDEKSENDKENEDIFFDSIDFNINPFNNEKPENKEKDNESDDLVLEEKEDDKFEHNNIQLNQKYHTSSDLIKINHDFENEPKEKDFYKNGEILPRKLDS